ncbi:MAG TPA: hypothetical protein VIH71_06975 [Solirubrobacteraceae bacterium]
MARGARDEHERPHATGQARSSECVERIGYSYGTADLGYDLGQGPRSRACEE